ncbi:MAG TPA: HEAT repeat domain-containing protein, partial [Nitrospiria bacterium]|nr:HEAT repeat domain-containing protein [Nitrospiria bacterium]
RTRCLQMAIDQVGEPKPMREIEDVLNHWGREETETVLEFFKQLSPNATYSLVELLGRLTQMKIRRMVCEALIVLAKDNPEPLIQRLSDSRWFVVRNLIFILGKIGDERVVDHFRPLVEHREIKVRKELVHTLESFKGPKAQDLLRWFLDDSDSQIRVQAVRVLAQNGYQGALGTLEDMVEEPSFLEKDLSEKKEFFEAMGKIGGEQVIPKMKGLIRKGKSAWFNKGPNEELGVCAVSALKGIATEEAKAILKEGQGYSNKTIQEACRKALLEIARPNRRGNV